MGRKRRLGEPTQDLGGRSGQRVRHDRCNHRQSPPAQRRGSKKGGSNEAIGRSHGGSQMPGFVAYYAVDAGEGVMVSTSVFEHQAAEEESSWRAGQFVAEHIAPLSPNPPQITAGDVVAHKKSS